MNREAAPARPIIDTTNRPLATVPPAPTKNENDIDYKIDRAMRRAAVAIRKWKQQ